jgi:hypothetical protein
MRMERWAAAMFLGAMAAACGRGRATTDTGVAPQPAQQFTRAVTATSARTVQAAVAAFGDDGIPVATADEAGGFVQSVPLDLAAQWGKAPVEQRVNCVNGAAAAGQIRLAVQVRSTATGSTLTLQSLPAGNGDEHRVPSSCVLRSEFLSRLLDDIATRASAQ